MWVIYDEICEKINTLSTNIELYPLNYERIKMPNIIINNH